MGFKPLGNRILVKIIKTKISQATKTKGGIYLPETTTKKSGLKPMQGVVAAVGQGTWTQKGQHIPICFNVGDTVVFREYTGHPIDVDGEDHLLIEENLIVGTLKPEQGWSKYNDLPRVEPGEEGGSNDVD